MDKSLRLTFLGHTVCAKYKQYWAVKRKLLAIEYSLLLVLILLDNPIQHRRLQTRSAHQCHHVVHGEHGFNKQRKKPAYSIHWSRSACEYLWRTLYDHQLVKCSSDWVCEYQGWASECPDVKNYKWRLNPVWHRMFYSCTNNGNSGPQRVKEGLEFRISQFQTRRTKVRSITNMRQCCCLSVPGSVERPRRQ